MFYLSQKFKSDSSIQWQIVRLYKTLAALITFCISKIDDLIHIYTYSKMFVEILFFTVSVCISQVKLFKNAPNKSPTGDLLTFFKQKNYNIR